MAAAIGAKWKHVRTATLLLRAVLFVAVVEGGAVPGEDGDAETVLDRGNKEGLSRMPLT